MIEKGELIYETKPDRGFIFRAFDLLPQSKGYALIEVEREGKLIKSFEFPAYKVWNITAHASDIIDSELASNSDGYYIAGSDGLGGNSFA